MYYFKISPEELSKMDDDEVIGHWARLHWIRTEEKRLNEESASVPASGKKGKKRN